MEQENNQIFLSDSLRVKSLFLLLDSYRYVFIMLVPLSMILTYVFLETRPSEFEASLVIDRPDIFKNYLIINKYNFISDKLSNEASYSGFNTLSNDELFNIFLRLFKDKEVVIESILNLGLIDEKKYSSDLLYKKALRELSNNVKLDYKKLSSFERLLWDQGALKPKYMFTNRGKDQDKVSNLMFEISDKISIEGKKIIITAIDNAIKYTSFIDSQKIKEITNEIDKMKIDAKSEIVKKIQELDIEKLPILLRNEIINEIEYLKNEILIAENLDIVYPKKYENDNFAFLASENKSSYLNHYYDGTIALQARVAELKQVISSEDAFNSYNKKINLSKFLELERLNRLVVSKEFFDEYFKNNNLPIYYKLEKAFEGQLLKELTEFRNVLSESSITFVNLNRSSIQVTKSSVNISIALLLAAIFGTLSSFIYIFIHRTLHSD